MADGAERRAFLGRINRGIEYFVPPELRSVLGFAAEMTPTAAMERAGTASREVFAPGRTPMQRVESVGDMLSETASVAAPVAVAGRAALPAAEALQEALLGVSVPAREVGREVVERLSQPGRMPDAVYSGFDPLAAFRAAREAMLGASRETPFEDLQRLASTQSAAREAAIAELSQAPSVRLYDPKDRAVVVGPGMGPTEEGKFRVTYFDADRKPSNHVVYETKEEALGAALREGFASPVPPLPAPRNASEEMADEVASLLRQGRADEIDEGMLRVADDRRLFQLYDRGEVGMDLPMDFESRMARAREMGFKEDEYHGSLSETVHELDPRMARGERSYAGTYTSTNPYVASSYADYGLGSMYPLLTRGMPEESVRVDAGGGMWSQIPGTQSVSLGGREYPLSTLTSEPGSRGMYDTNQVGRIAFYEGLPGTEFTNIVDRGPYFPIVPGDPSVMRRFQEEASKPSTVRARQDTRGVRSRFARFDPRLAGLRNLMAGTAGSAYIANEAMSEDEPAVRNYAQGGAVMPGIGGLSGVARDMYRGPRGVGGYEPYVRGYQFGGAVGGSDPLAPYAQHLKQTYFEPIAESASRNIQNFVSGVRQKEQQYFGTGGGNQLPGTFGTGMGQMQNTFGTGLPPNINQAAPSVNVMGSPGPFGNNFGQMGGFAQQRMQQRMGGFSPSVDQTVANQANMLAAQQPTGNEPIGGGLSDLFQNKFGENWADQFSLYTENNRPLLSMFAEGGEVTGANLAEIATQIAIDEGVDPALFLKLIGVESSGNQGAVSPKGALGLTQLMPATAKELGVDPTDPIDNLRGGARYLKQQLDRFDGNQVLALAAYNAGPGAVEKYGGVPPFKETMDYVNKILGPDVDTRSFYSDFARFVDEGNPLPPPDRPYALTGRSPAPEPRPAPRVPASPVPVPRPAAIEPVASPEMGISSLPSEVGSRPSDQGMMGGAYTGAPVYASVSEIPSVSAPSAVGIESLGRLARRNTR